MNEAKKEFTILDLTGTDARIMYVLPKKQPQSTEDLIKAVEVTKHTFLYRRLPVLKGLKIVKEIAGEWALTSYPLDEKPWRPKPGDVKLCLKALMGRETEEVRNGFLWDLGSILDSGYWDLQLEDFFTKALNHPEDFKKEIEELLRARLNRPEEIDVFLKSKRERLYDLAKRPSEICSRAFGAFLDVSEGREVLDKLEAALEGEEAEAVIAAAQHYHRSLYDKYGLEFMRILHKALKHERGSVREIAVETMKEIARRRRAL